MAGNTTGNRVLGARKIAERVSRNSRNSGSLEFRDLSQEAQSLIVDASMGIYDNDTPEISESVKDEIRRWATSGIPENKETGISYP